MPKSKKKKNNRGTSTDIQSTEKTEEVNYSLDDFINWVNEDEQRKEIFAGIDWDFYRKKNDWIVSLKKWNTLRTDRLELISEWQND